MCHVTRYIICMIKTFANKETEELYCEGRSASFPADVVKRALRKLDMLDAASGVADLRMPPGNRLHILIGDRLGQHAIAVNDQWCICFRFEEGDAFDVEICDYH